MACFPARTRCCKAFVQKVEVNLSPYIIHSRPEHEASPRFDDRICLPFGGRSSWDRISVVRFTKPKSSQ